MNTRRQDMDGSILFRDGQSQDGRRDPALDPTHPGFVKIDDRGLADLYAFVRGYAAQVVFPDSDPGEDESTWEAFFDALPADLASALSFANDDEQARAALASSGSVPPHLALLLTFLRLYRHGRQQINGLTQKHLDLYLRDVLGFALRPAVGDRVHLLFELKKKVASQMLAADTRFSAGKDATGKPMHFRLEQDLMVYPAKIEALRSVYKDATAPEAVRIAPVADSGDGLGQALDKAAPHWPAFGHGDLPLAQIGFALASPVLRLQQGRRTIHADLTLTGKGPAPSLFDNAFEVYLSGEKGWLGPLAITTRLLSAAQGLYRLSVSLTPDQGAVVDFEEEIHGGRFAAEAPVMQFKLKTANSSGGYAAFKHLSVQSCRLSVEALGVSSLALENDLGKIDSTKPFMPFGPEPRVGAKLHVGYSEALDKNIDRLELHLTWRDAPRKFSNLYNMSGYQVNDNSHFKVDVAAPLGAVYQTFANRTLFDDGNAGAVHELTLPPEGAAGPGPGRKPKAEARERALARQGSRWAQKALLRIRQTSKVHARQPGVGKARPLKGTASVDARPGFISLGLKQSFLHQAYRELYTRKVIDLANKVENTSLPNAPYTPVIESLLLDYVASSATVDISGASEADFLNDEVTFFHLTAFGQMCDHAYIRGQLPYVPAKAVPLLPAYAHAGEFYIGFSGMLPEQSLSLLFQVAEGTANPLKPKQPIQWSILADNYWKPLEADQILNDSTNGLLTSGRIVLAIPPEATDTNTTLPFGWYWLRAAVQKDADALCRLLDVRPNAGCAAFVDQGNDPGRLRQALPPGSVIGFVTPVAGIKKVMQPYASFGGRGREDDPAFYTRAGERLRHKQRAVTAWDYERLILEQFPAVYKVKCLNHTAPGALLAPGHVTLVVVPRLASAAGTDALQPRVDLNTLDEIKTYIAGLCGPGVEIHVENPVYEELYLSFGVRFHPPYEAEAGHYRTLLNDEIQRLLSPWVYQGSEALSFGGRVHPSTLLRFVETRAYVDYAAELNLYLGSARRSVEVAEASDPRAVLVSAKTHDIRKIEST